jgi:uncharacterized protein YndB with AHSA1/START domain
MTGLPRIDSGAVFATSPRHRHHATSWLLFFLDRDNAQPPGYVFRRRRLPVNAATDRVEKQILLKAPRSRVWHALADAEAFGAWFGVALKGQRFVAGEPARGHITNPGYEHLQFEITLERIEPERLMSFHWHPYAVDTTRDYANEPPTLVTFDLEEVEGGTLLRVIESGFERIPAQRRAEAFRMNSGGWEQQMKNIQRHVETH